MLAQKNPWLLELNVNVFPASFDMLTTKYIPRVGINQIQYILP